MSLEPDIGKAAAAARFTEVFLEREEGAVRIEFGRFGVFNQLADVEKMRLRRRFFERVLFAQRAWNSGTFMDTPATK
ncbi:MAG: hypothetical protein R2843_13615 [Thermomicrobiales bacterium]